MFVYAAIVRLAMRVIEQCISLKCKSCSLRGFAFISCRALIGARIYFLSSFVLVFLSSLAFWFCLVFVFSPRTLFLGAHSLGHSTASRCLSGMVRALSDPYLD